MQIDYSTMRRGKRISAQTKIDICPKCGKKGKISETNKGTIIVHTSEVKTGYALVTASCYIKKI